MIYLSSFFGPGRGPRFSIARWAPTVWSGDRHTLAWLGARDAEGAPLRHLSPDLFRVRYMGYLLLTKYEELAAWLNSLDPEKDMTLCCWCTLERQRPHPKLFCHRILVGYLIEEYRPDVPVSYVGGAQQPVWEK